MSQDEYRETRLSLENKLENCSAILQDILMDPSSKDRFASLVKCRKMSSTKPIMTVETLHNEAILFIRTNNSSYIDDHIREVDKFIEKSLKIA